MHDAQDMPRHQQKCQAATTIAHLMRWRCTHCRRHEHANIIGGHVKEIVPSSSTLHEVPVCLRSRHAFIRLHTMAQFRRANCWGEPGITLNKEAEGQLERASGVP